MHKTSTWSWAATSFICFLFLFFFFSMPVRKQSHFAHKPLETYPGVSAASSSTAPFGAIARMKNSWWLTSTVPSAYFSKKPKSITADRERMVAFFFFYLFSHRAIAFEKILAHFCLPGHIDVAVGAVAVVADPLQEVGAHWHLKEERMRSRGWETPIFMAIRNRSSAQNWNKTVTHVK